MHLSPPCFLLLSVCLSVCGNFAYLDSNVINGVIPPFPGSSSIITTGVSVTGLLFLHIHRSYPRPKNISQTLCTAVSSLLLMVPVSVSFEILLKPRMHCGLVDKTKTNNLCFRSTHQPNFIRFTKRFFQIVYSMSWRSPQQRNPQTSDHNMQRSGIVQDVFKLAITLKA